MKNVEQKKERSYLNMGDINPKIFVFGSNLAGRHGKGAALIARMHHGAIYGLGEGLQGQSYGIPTKDENLRVLSLLEIKRHVDKFILFAKRHSSITFNVTAIGTGYAGYKHDDIGPMFYDAPFNCVLPFAWRDYVSKEHGHKFWVS